MPIRLMLVDDHEMFREALRVILERQAEFLVVAEAANGGEALHILEHLRPDILLLDVALPDLNGIEVARRIAECQPEVKIVVLSGFADRFFVVESLKAGARAFVLKSSGSKELIRAIHAVDAGHVFLSPEVTGLAVGGASAGEGADKGRPPLTPREKEVLVLIVSGKRSAEIARQLNIAIATVEVHRRNIRRKLEIFTVAELTRYAIREGLLDER